MGPEAGWIEHNALFGLVVGDGRISTPEITMNQARFDRPSVAFERAEKSGDDFVKQPWEQTIKLRVWPTSLLANLQDVAQTIGKEDLPAVRTTVVLGEVTVVCCAVETKFAFGGRVARVQPGQLLTEILGLGDSIEELIEFAQIEVGVGCCL